jgi:hypothetical protein
LVLEWGEVVVGSIFLGISSLLRAWGRINLRLPVYARPVAFQQTRFPLFLSMLWNGFWVLGALMLFMSGFLLGLVGLAVYFGVLLPGLSYLLSRILKYDQSAGGAAGGK